MPSKANKTKKTLSEMLGINYRGLLNSLLKCVIAQEETKPKLQSEVYIVVQRSADNRSAPSYDLVIGKLVNDDISVYKRNREPAGVYKTISSFYRYSDVQVTYGVQTSIVLNRKELVNIHHSRVLIRERVTTAVMPVVTF